MILLVLLDDWVISVLAGSDYVDAAPVLAGLAAATLIRGAYVFFPGLFVARRTGLVALINIGGVAVSLLLCWAAVPLWGLRGAALAAVVSALVTVWPMYALGQRYLRVTLMGRDPSLAQST